MILDSGICTVFRKVDVSQPAAMPRVAYTPIYKSWYGELNYETTPNWQTDGRKDLRVDRRVRVLQCKELRQNDVVVLEGIPTIDDRSPGADVYQIIRAYHGEDPDGPTRISDLSLEVIRP